MRTHTVAPPAGPVVQAQLTVNAPGDQYEQEADRVAETVMRMPEPIRTPREEAERGKMQRKGTQPGAALTTKEGLALRRATPKAGLTAPPTIVDQTPPLPNRALESPTSGYDLSRAPVHADIETMGSLRPGSLSISGQQDVGPPTGLTRPRGGSTGLPASAPVTANEINSDLGTAQTWATTAAQKMQRYSGIVRFIAQDRNMAYRIGNTRLGRGEVHGVNCPIRSNFNLDPVSAQPTAYASAMLAISARLNGIKARLDRLGPQHFRNVSVTSTLCDQYGAFVVSNSLPIYLCTGYWLGAFRRPATIIHEVAHVQGMDDQEYIRARSMGLPPRECLRNTRFSIDAADTIRNPDSYAYFCADLRS